jgi:hypothetical protein
MLIKSSSLQINKSSKTTPKLKQNNSQQQLPNPSYRTNNLIVKQQQGAQIKLRMTMMMTKSKYQELIIRYSMQIYLFLEKLRSFLNISIDSNHKKLILIQS